MNYDFYAEIWEEYRDEKLDWKKLRKKIYKYGSIYTKIKTMALGIPHDNTKNELKEKAYKKEVLNNYSNFILDQLSLMDILSLKNPHFDLITLPKYTFFLHVQFTFDKPYMSKDDEEFYIHENPISKEKVFKIPYIKASSWKGNLRWVARQLSDDKNEIVRIFGNEKEEKDERKLRRGRLNTFPTFFDNLRLDIINPQDRRTRTGTKPIMLEVVPESSQGDLHLLYIPFDKVGQDAKELEKEVEKDLRILSRTIRALLTEYGMSAKRKSGYGATRIGKTVLKSNSLMKYTGEYNNLNKLIDKLNENSNSFKNTTEVGEAK